MANCITVNTDGTFSLTTLSPADCTSYVLLDASDFRTMVESYDIASADVLYVFSWGFGAVLFFWSMGYAVGVAKSLINKV